MGEFQASFESGYPIRFTEEEKRTAEKALLAGIRKMGYEAELEKGGRSGHHWIRVGDAEHAPILLCAHYDTPSRKILPNLQMPGNLPMGFLWQVFSAVVYMLPAFLLMFAALLLGLKARLALGLFVVTYGLILYALRQGRPNRNNRNAVSGLDTVLTVLERVPEEMRKRVACVLTDDGEKGRMSSRLYAQAHPEVQYTRLCVNLSYTGRGKTLTLIRPPLAAKCTGYGKLLHTLEGMEGFTVREADSRWHFGPTDRGRFRCGCEVMAADKKPLCLLVPALHTPGDTVRDEKNVEAVARALTEVIQGLG